MNSSGRYTNETSPKEKMKRYARIDYNVEWLKHPDLKG